jgi:hypothetical protein
MGSAAKKVGNTLKKITKSAEEAVSFAINPTGYITGTIGEAITGKKAVKTAFNPGGEITGEAGEYLVDKPKAARAAEKEAANQAEALRQKTKRDIETKRRQESAEATAADRLNRARAAQTRRRGGRGRSSTILTNSLGGTGGEMNQGRKSLLGL